MTNEEQLNNEISRLALRLSKIDNVAEYTATVGNVRTLIEIKEKLYPIQPDPWYLKVLANPAAWGVASNLLISGMVLNHERINIITSRAFGFVKTR